MTSLSVPAKLRDELKSVAVAKAQSTNPVNVAALEARLSELNARLGSEA